jgi:hypothetical protein
MQAAVQQLQNHFQGINRVGHHGSL